MTPEHSKAACVNDDYAGYGEILERLTAENERLREALTEIAEHPGLAFMQDRTWRDIAKEALRDE